jgi:DNA gyrase/topoisomerase IV subunit A
VLPPRRDVSNGAIIGMSQNYVGSNNINVLLPNGQFGSRLNGNDSASERYIYTCLNPITRRIFNEADDAILNYLDDDGRLLSPSIISHNPVCISEWNFGHRYGIFHEDPAL